MVRRKMIQRLAGDSFATFLGFGVTFAALLTSMWIADRNLRSIVGSGEAGVESRSINLSTGALELVLVVGVFLLVRRSQNIVRVANERLSLERERLRVTVQCIGDGLIVTDAQGTVTQMNPVAETLTGWPEADALGRPLQEVFRIVNVDTRLPVENPALRALREGTIVGLANRTVLIDRAGYEWPLDDSGSPIREGDRIVGSVLVFREVSERYAAEKIVADARQFAENIVDTVREPLLVLDADLRVVSLNRAFASTFRIDPTVVVGQVLRELGNGQWDIPVLRDLLDRIIVETLIVTDFEVVHDFPGIGVRRMMLNARRIYQPGNHSQSILLAFEDVSVRHEAEDALRHSEARLRFTLDNISDYAIFPIDLDANIVGWNRGAQKVFGWEEKAIVGKPFAALFTPEDREEGAPARELSEAARTGRGIDERWHIHQDGSRFYASGVVTPAYDEAGKLRGYTKLARDVTEQRRAERVLAEVREESGRQKRLYETIFDTTPDLVFVFDLQHRFTFANTALLQLWGRTVEDAIGRTCLELGYPEWHAAMHSREIEQVRATGKPIRGDVPFTGTEGERMYDYIFVPVFGADGEVEAVAGTTRDVTDRRRSENEVREARVFLGHALDALTAQIAILDEKGVILEVNEAWRTFARANGYASDTFGVGENYFQVCSLAAHMCGTPTESIAAGVRAVIDGTIPLWQTEYPCHSPTEDRWFLMRATKFKIDGPTRAVVAHENITSRVRFEQATLRQTVQLRRLTDSAAHVNAANDVRSVVGVVLEEARGLIGSNQAIALIRPEATDGVAVHRASFADASARDYAPLEDGTDIFSLAYGLELPMRLTRSELEAHPKWHDFVASLPDRPRPCGLLAAPMIARDGQSMGVIELSDRNDGEFTEDDQNMLVQLTAIASVAIDNARLVEQLVDADGRKNEFLAMLAHELRNPLAPIRNAVQIMSIASDNPRAVEQSRTIIERQLQQMVRLVDDLLDISRVNRGKIALQTKTLDIASVVSAALEQTRPLIDSQQHQIAVELPRIPILLIGDETRLTQAVGNLITNAAKYTERGGRIRVSVSREGSQAVVSVRDNGVGLPADMLAKVFDMFTQVDTSLERSQGGLGIGLTLVKRLVEMHDGSVEARSDGPGCGSEFLVRLPAIEADTVSVVKSEPDLGPVERSVLRILVADDNVDSADSLSMMLQLSGNRVVTANDGLAAVELAESFRPDVILTDIGMPKMNGYEVARRVRERPWAKGVVIVALTGWGKDEDRTRTGEAGFDHHMVKPVDIKALNTVLAGVANRNPKSSANV